MLFELKYHSDFPISQNDVSIEIDGHLVDYKFDNIYDAITFIQSI